jgi:flagellar biosynthetic protein FlhB
MAQPDRTEKPTPKRRRDAREKGQIPRSKEVSAAGTFLVVLIFLAAGSSYFYSEFKALFSYLWGSLLYSEISVLTARELVVVSLWGVMKLAGPVLVLTLVVALGTSFAQGGVVFAVEPLKFKGDKINPAKNLQKVFSKRGLMELVKSLGLVTIVVYLAFTVIRDYLGVFQMMVVMDLRTILSTWGSAVFSIGLRIGIFLVVVAIADYLFQRYTHEEGLKQTKQEVKDDLKDTEGQPLVKARIRRLQREMARRRMLAAVKTADVVITNPTHYAVALKYEMDSMTAPEVVAKGKEYLAQKIREIADKHKVPIVEDRELARTLYKLVEVGDEVPANLYKAVAQILAYVYKLKSETYH